MSGGPGDATGLRVGLLGPVQLGPVQLAADTLRRPALRVLLATLALAANRVVPDAILIDALWQEEPSRQRERNLHAQVYQLRNRLAELEPDRSRDRLVRREPGYRLALGDEELDLIRFDRLVGRGRAAAAAGTHATAAALLRSAVGLWRGPALADVATLSDRMAAEAALLEERRLAALEDCIDAELAAGQLSGLAAELARLVGEYPLRERLAGQLMLALYRSGRQADALQAFRATRLVLAEQLGIDPGPELRDLHQRMLQGDAGLLHGAQQPSASLRSDGVSAVYAPATPRQLPADLASFVGRQDELKELDEILDMAADSGGTASGGTVVITAIGGTGGIGKTALALHWAHKVADRYPDGQLHVNLRGFEPGGSPVTPEAALQGFLTGLGLPPQQIPHGIDAQTALYRSLLADRRMIVVLDNARDPAQVRPLLPASPGSLVIVTSRAAMTGLTVSEGAIPIPLTVLTRFDANALLTARLGAERVGKEPEALADLIRICAGLPLALAITAARAATAPSMPLAALAAEFRREQRLLDELDTGDQATSIRALFSCSVQHLSTLAARLFRLLSLHPGPDVTIAAAASVGATDQAAAGRLVAELTAASLLTEHVPGRYVLHDLLRAYAREQAAEVESEQERQATISRVLDHYLHTARAAALELRAMDDPITLDSPELGVVPERITTAAAATKWLAAEHDTLLSAISLAAATGHDSHAWQIPWTLANYHFMQGTHNEWIAVSQGALAAAERTGDDLALGWSHYRLAHAYQEANRRVGAPREAGSFEDAATHYRAAAEHFRLAGSRTNEAAAYMGLHMVARQQDQRADAQRHVQQAMLLFEQAGSRRGQASALTQAAYFQIYWGDLALARGYARQAADIYGQLGDQYGLAYAWTNLADAHRRLGEFADAVRFYRQALEIDIAIGHRTAQADVLAQLGDVMEATGDLAAARGYWRQALELTGDAYPEAAVYLRRKLGETAATLDQPEPA